MSYFFYCWILKYWILALQFNESNFLFWKDILAYCKQYRAMGTKLYLYRYYFVLTIWFVWLQCFSSDTTVIYPKAQGIIVYLGDILLILTFAKGKGSIFVMWGIWAMVVLCLGCSGFVFVGWAEKIKLPKFTMYQ